MFAFGMYGVFIEVLINLCVVFFAGHSLPLYMFQFVVSLVIAMDP